MLFCLSKGSKLAHVVDGIKAGVGTYERDGIIYSSLVGSVQRETQDNGLASLIQTFVHMLIFYGVTFVI